MLPIGVNEHVVGDHSTVWRAIAALELTTTAA